MKVRTNLAVLGMLLIAGCASARQEWVIARTALTTTQNSLVTANSAELLSDEDFVATKPFLQAAQAGLQTADEELVRNQEQATNRFRYYLNAARSALKSAAGVPRK